MKKFIALISAVLLVFSLAACGDTKHSDGNTLKEITLCLDWTPNTNHTGFFVADKLGFYEKEGIKLTIVQPPEDGAELMTASGQAQFGVSFQDFLLPSFALEEPLEVTAVAALVQHNTSGIITRKGEAQNRPKGLEGKRFSTWNLPVEVAMMKNIVEKDGGDFNKVELIPSVVTNEAEALKNNDTDAIWIFYAWAGIACELSDLEFDYFSFIDINSVFDYYTPVLIANNAFLKSDPDTAKAFLAATQKGYEYAIENPEEAAEILVEGDTTGSLKASTELVAASQKWIADKYIDDASKWGIIQAERWDSFNKWVYDEGLIEREIPQGFGFTNDYLG